MKFRLITTFLIIVNTIHGIGQSGKSCTGKYPEDLTRLSDSRLGKAFLKLKKSNNVDCSVYNSDLHRIMNTLRDRLGKDGTEVKKIFELMGYPDSYTDELEVAKLNEGETVWIYQWRGWHDWLYFVVKDNLVVRSDWWLAYE